MPLRQVHERPAGVWTERPDGRQQEGPDPTCWGRGRWEGLGGEVAAVVLGLAVVGQPREHRERGCLLRGAVDAVVAGCHQRRRLAVNGQSGRVEDLDVAAAVAQRCYLLVEPLKTQSPTKRGRQMTGIEIEPDSFHGNGLAPSGVVR